VEPLELIRVGGPVATPRSLFRFFRIVLTTLLLFSPRLADADCVVVFDEVMYHPAAPDPATESQREWIELRSEMAVDIDLSGWRLAGGVNYLFPPGTILSRGARILIAGDPAAFQAATGVSGALGPWTGQLSNDGERIELRDNNDRVMDSLEYGTNDDWPTAADGGGASLAKKSAGLATSDHHSWKASRTIGGSPGTENFPNSLPPLITTVIPLDGLWKYKTDGSDQGTFWRTDTFDDTSWPEARATFQLGSDVLPLPATAATSLVGGPTTYYFRRHFIFQGQPLATTLLLKLLADDGACVYLNGAELTRWNVPAGTLNHTALAASPQRSTPILHDFTIPSSALRNGDNVIAIELHQAGELAPFRSATIGAGPVAYWHLSETQSPVGDLADLANTTEAGAQTGTIQGMSPTSLGTAGPRPSDGLSGFDASNAGVAFQGNNDGGDDVVLFPDDGTLNFASAKKFSVEAWIKGPAAQEDGAAIICKGTGGGGEQFCLDVVSGRFRFFVRSGSGAAVVAHATVAPNNAWQHVAIAFDQAAGVMRLYVNGALAISMTPPATLLNTNHEVSLGARKGTSAPAYNLNFNGSIDEVALYNRALSASEVLDHYNAAFAANSAGADTTDAVFAAELKTSETPSPLAEASLVLNEVSTESVELINTTGAPLDLAGFRIIRTRAGTSAALPLPSEVLAGGALRSFTFPSIAGDRLLLVAPDDSTIMDSIDVKATPRARSPDGTGAWLVPSAETPNAANTVALHDEIVINEIMFDHPSSALFPPGSPRAGQWIELHNRSDHDVDIGGWRVSGGVAFQFPVGAMVPAKSFVVVAESPPGMVATHGLTQNILFGPWSGSLSHRDDQIILEDRSGNPADTVHYFGDRPWPEAANGGGSSLELRDSAADNECAEAWGASDESGKAAWQTFTWRGANNPSQPGEPTLWHELNLLLLDGPGECLIDDVRVTGTGTSFNLIQNGTFDAGAAHWRFLGTHRNSRVEPEAPGAANNVLHLIATGPGEYQGNQIESTFVDNQALVPDRIYEISLRARWLTGGGRLNTRLYFNRIPQTNVLNVVPHGGTPGGPNSRVTTNIGPTYHDLLHWPVAPGLNEPVTVSVKASDPDGVASLDLKYSVGGNAWQTIPMTANGDSDYAAIIPGQSTSVAVQFYVEGRDSAGALSFFPARGPNSRALYAVANPAGAGLLPPLRLVMTSADAAFLHTPVNALSNDYLGATLIESGTRAYYDAGVRLKGSFVGRNVARVGFNLKFNSDRLFRGVLDKVAVDRSMHTAVNNPAELIIKQIANRAGGIPGMYDDMTQFIHPIASYSGVASLRLAGFEDEYLDNQFPNGGDGNMFEFEVLRWALGTTDGDSESPKLPGNEGSGTGYTNLEITNYGNNKEAYRWNSLQTMQRAKDDYASMIALNKMFALNGAAFVGEANQRLDVESWLRTMAYQSLVGPADSVFTGSNIHNFRVYFRPHDGRALYMPWDWDSAFQRSTNASLVGGGNLAKVVTSSPDRTRRYHAHLADIISKSFNTGYMSRWTQHYGTLAGQNYSSYLNYISQRAAYVLNQLPTATGFSAVPGQVSGNGAAAITGTANIRVATIEVNGLAYHPFWTSNTTWTITVPLAPGSNTLVLRGLDFDGNAVPGTGATLHIDNPNSAGWPTLRINEWLASNQANFIDPSDNDSEDWFEIYNPTDQPADLSGWKLSDLPGNPALFVIPSGWSIPAHGYLIVWADNEAAQNPSAPGGNSNLHVNFKLDDQGETLLLTAPDNREIDRVSFGAQTLDHSEGRYSDGGTLVTPLTLPSPGAANIFARYDDVDFEGASPSLTVTTTPGTLYQLETSGDLQDWTTASEVTTATGTTLNFPVTVSGAQQFFRVRVRR
jgi:hypothetical protein